VRGSTQCPHTSFDANVKVARFDDTNLKYAEIMIRCVDCGQLARFRGMPMGLSPQRPTCTPSLDEATLPFVIGDEAYDDKSIGFTINMRGGEE
jgi:hypothetical protein